MSTKSPFNFRFSTHPEAKGFTLAELLIALVILGVIATFAIPKVLSSMENNHKKAVMRESLATLSQITYKIWQTGEVTDTNMNALFKTNLNCVKWCDDALADGCWTQPYVSGWGTNSNACVLANGTVIADMTNGAGTGCSGRCDGFALDWNGADGPNIEGDDQMKLWVNCSSQISNGVAPGTIGPSTQVGYAASIPLYEWVFSN